jgi:hypothetical protein
MALRHTHPGFLRLLLATIGLSDLSAMTFGASTYFQLFVVRNMDDTVYVLSERGLLDSGLVLDGSFATNERVSKQGIAFDPSNDLIYVANRHNGSVSVIKGPDPYQPKAALIGEIPILDPDSIAVNPETHMIYVRDYNLGFVYAINSKCITAGDIKKYNNTPIKVGILLHHYDGGCQPEYKHGLRN